MLKKKNWVMIAASLGLGMVARQANAATLDLTSLTPGISGITSFDFEGFLGEVSVTGALVTRAPEFRILGVGSNFNNSIIDNSSPQFSNSSIYTPAQSLGDKVGYRMSRMSPSNTGTARLQINFSEAVTNPIFHVANLDSMMYNFSPTGGLSELSLLSGNGADDGDGLVVEGLIVKDANPLTIVGVSPAVPVPTNPTPRSAYGSIQLLGTFTSLDIDLLQNPDTTGGDGGAFTITTATVAEPASVLSLLAVGTLGAGLLKRKSKTKD